MVTLKKQVPVSRALKTAVHDMRGLQKWWLGVRNPQHIWRGMHFHLKQQLLL